ncbi:HEAT repeat domain-containing protein [Dactylosporangium fulvum]|uniref:HEAT repeat domain-containing protein n=1 Tax=Dactylosporangium fulvum TaxID=53359 RepID=A0ABY5VP55_9ACTN|nr:hypothetical protein [Dactylosporangium fulvum]UWP78874.1 hypothetical protein Dfulv_27290 [Dactylosporangium fulvum]
MIDPEAVLADTDWASLEHAYTDAADLPERLVGLLSGDPDTAGSVLGVLDAAVLHQGSIYSATAPTALYVAGILGDPRTLIPCESALPWDERARPLRAALLEWLGDVAESASWGEDPDDEDEEDEPDEDDEADVAACRAIRRDLFQVVALYLDDADESVRTAAEGAAGHLLLAPDLAESRQAVAERMLERVRQRPPHERANTALTVARWGVAPRELLTDAEPAVRAYAALAPALDGEPAALAVVREALLDPETADGWFADHEMLLDGWLRFALVQTLLRRTTTFTEIRDEALAVARMTNAYTVDSDWGPLLQRAFPARHTPGTPLHPAQHAFLTALVENDECWNGIANMIIWFSRAGLPHEREELRTLLRSSR